MTTCNYQPDDKHYGPCIREAGHEGPCAYPFANIVEPGFTSLVRDGEVEAAWQQFLATHIRPSRLLEIWEGKVQSTEGEQRHLGECEGCRKLFNGFSEAPNPHSSPQPGERQ